MFSWGLVEMPANPDTNIIFANRMFAYLLYVPVLGVSPSVSSLSRSVTHPWLGYLEVVWGAETRGIDVSHHAESIGGGPRV